jgi:hypothetical protein
VRTGVVKAVWSEKLQNESGWRNESIYPQFPHDQPPVSNEAGQNIALK